MSLGQDTDIGSVCVCVLRCRPFCSTSTMMSIGLFSHTAGCLGSLTDACVHACACAQWSYFVLSFC